ncbi:MAG: hypothetical protein ACLTMR_03980 [Faecalibacillus sp.]
MKTTSRDKIQRSRSRETDGYTPKVKVIEDGKQNADKAGTDAGDLSSAATGQTNSR